MVQSNAGYRNNKKLAMATDEDEINMVDAATPPLQDTEKLASNNEHISTGKGGSGA